MPPVCGLDASLNAKRMTANLRFAMLLIRFPDRPTQFPPCAQYGYAPPARAAAFAAAQRGACDASVAVVINCGDA
ncbi:hypothetical protein GCM10027093_23190 [Paraburkholderia jirisanensis]